FRRQRRQCLDRQAPAREPVGAVSRRDDAVRSGSDQRRGGRMDPSQRHAGSRGSGDPLGPVLTEPSPGGCRAGTIFLEKWFRVLGANPHRVTLSRKKRRLFVVWGICMEWDRAIVVVLDGVGIGEAPDAREYGDEGSNTIVNTAKS